MINETHTFVTSDLQSMRKN